MPSKNSEASTKKTNTQPSKSKKNTLASKANGTKNRNYDRHQMIASAAYFRAEKRGFKGNGADTVHDWLEAEVEIEIGRK